MRLRIEPGSSLLRLVAVGVLAIVAGTAGYLTRGSARLQLPATPAPADSVETVRGTVQSRTDTSLVLITEEGSVTLRLTPATMVEVLRDAGLASLRAGDWINAGGVAHAQTLYALTAIVAIPSELLREGR